MTDTWTEVPPACAGRRSRAGSPRSARPSAGRPGRRRTRWSAADLIRAPTDPSPSTIRRTRSPTSVGSNVGRQDAAREPVEIEQVRHQPLEPASVVLDPAGELPRLLGLQPDVATLERDRQAEDRCERRPEVVRHGLEERVLHLVERAQPDRGLALDLEGALQVLLRALAVADVPDESRERRSPRRPPRGRSRARPGSGGRRDGGAWISIRAFRTLPSPVSCQRRSPSLWAARCACGTIVSTSGAADHLLGAPPERRLRLRVPVR